MSMFILHLLLLQLQNILMISKQTVRIFVLFFFNFLILFSHSVQAQEQEKENFFERSSIVSRVHYGFLLAHHDRVAHLVRHTYGFEISLSRQETGKKAWHQNYNYPQTGYSYIYLDFNYPDVLGNAHALLAFINFPFVKSEKFQFSLRMASGLGYVTKKFERIENHKNDVIGSHINAAIQFNFESRYRLSSQLFYNFNLGLTHFSNGSFRTPNLGINNPSVNTGLTWQLNPSKEIIKREINIPDKRLQVDIMYAVWVKEISPPTGDKFFTHIITSTLMKRVSNKVKLGIGVDIFYDLSLKEAFRRNDQIINDNSKLIRSGIHFDTELMTDKLSILLQAGAYLLDQYKSDGLIYNRLGFKYMLNRHLFVNLTLKSHFAKADCVEPGIGWKFVKD